MTAWTGPCYTLATQWFYLQVWFFFMHMILMDSDNQLAMNLGETYLVTTSGNERLGKKKLDLVIG